MTQIKILKYVLPTTCHRELERKQISTHGYNSTYLNICIHGMLHKYTILASGSSFKYSTVKIAAASS